MAEYKGVLTFYSETGTEGGYWAFQDEKFIEPASITFPDGHWLYEGLHVLENGDDLTIYGKDEKEGIIWHGLISLTPFSVFEQDAFGMWIHSDQIGVERETWTRWFMQEYPATLVTVK